MSAPLVSCLMVTQPVPRRLPYFKQTVADYLRQTHAPRELVVVLDRGDAATREAFLAHVASLARDDIRVVEPPGKLTLGALRNQSFAHARGELVCQWDDDELFHPERVATQVGLLRELGAEATCLEEVLHYFPESRTLYCINFRKTVPRAMPGSLLMRRGLPVRYPEDGPKAERGEDTALVAQLHALGTFRVATGHAHLYVYQSHGANTWNDEHHRMLAKELSLSKALLQRREAQIRAGLAPIDFGPGEVTVTGYNGVAFVLGVPR
jgi:glycosyltransferase involved in cell wall biosynthesis